MSTLVMVQRTKNSLEPHDQCYWTVISDITLGFLKKNVGHIVKYISSDSMRSAWIEHVAQTKAKGNRGKKTMTHREAMAAASLTWPKKKKKLERIRKKQAQADTPKTASKHEGEKLQV